MADPSEAGTPPTEAPVSESAGTGATAADGSEQAGKPVDPALAMAWKEKAERVNAAETRLREAEARLAAIEQQRYAAQQATDPMSQMVSQLRERAQYGDADASAQLQILTLQATQQADFETFREMTRSGVPPALQDTVLGLVRQSGYRMPVAQAAQLARGSEVPDLAKQLEAERQRVAALQKALDARTVGNGTPGNPASTTPAAMSAGDAPEMTPEEYRAIIARGGPEALALRDKGVRFKT